MSDSDSRKSLDDQVRPNLPQTQLAANRAADAPDAGGRPECDVDATCKFKPAAALGDSNPSSSSTGPDNATVDLVTSGHAADTPAVDAKAKVADTVAEGSPVHGGLELTGLGNYQLISEVARGGMGVVYRARQRSLNRIVAVKMILAGQLASEADVQRFRSEAEAVANLQHPNILAIYEVGEVGGHHFFSMPFVEGHSLAEVIRTKPMSAQEAVDCLRTLADAVDYAHGQGILHRDLKPSNILIDAAGVLFLTDFGVAKQLRSDSQLTATGTIIGTPSYMPPEQAVGDKEISRTADVYSLGAILYELLTGRPPFTAQRATDVLMQVLSSEPVSPRVLNPSVPMDLSTICLKCLEKAPERRYGTARALSADLGCWLKGKPILARPIGRVERGWRWCKRSPVVASMAALLMLVAVAAFIGVTSQWLIAQSALRRMLEAQTQRASAQIDSLLKAAPESMASVLNHLKPQYDEIAPQVRRLMVRRDLSDHDRLRLSLALLPGDPKQVDYLRGCMLSIGFAELLAVREALSPYHEQLRDELWSVLNSAQAKPEERFSAALILAHGKADESQRAEDWAEQAPFVAARLLDAVTTNPSSYKPLVEALRPVRRTLSPSLAKTFRDRSESQLARAFATNILVTYVADQPAELASLLVEADPWQFLVIRPRLTKSMSVAIDVLTSQLAQVPPARASNTEKEAIARRRASAAVAMLQLGVGESVWPLLVHGDDPRVRSQLIELFCLLKAEPRLLIDRLDEEPDVSARRAILLALGSYEQDTVSEQDRQRVLARCVNVHASDPDAGIHAASEWVLRRWGQPAALSTPGSSLEGPPRPEFQWCLGPEGHILAAIDGRVKAAMGSPSTEEGRSIAEASHQMSIERKFALGTKEVTVAQFRRFSKATGLKMPPFSRKHSPDDDGPMIMATWYRAAQYCRWLSEQAGLPEDQMCYPAISEIREGLQPVADYLNRSGFRLPTEAEWEFACRAGATTSRAFGSSDELLPRYAWYQLNANDRAWPVGSLKPNDFGLFDMYGNAWEWCGDHWSSYWENPRGRDIADLTVVDAASNRMLRGGSFDSGAKALRSAFRDRFEKPQFGSDEIGFRIARTLPD